MNNTKYLDIKNINPDHNLYILRFFLEDGTSVIKFGYTTNIRQRMNDYLGSNPTIYILFTAFKSDAKEFEQYIHNTTISLYKREYYKFDEYDKLVESIETEFDIDYEKNIRKGKKSFEDYANDLKDCKNKSEMLLILDSIKNNEWKDILEYGIKTKKILVTYSEAKSYYNNRIDYGTLAIHIQNTFKIGQFYSKAEVKSKLKFIYESKNIKRTAKATDILEFTTVLNRMISIDGKRIDGFEIVSYK